MKRKRYTEEQIISILKEREAGASVPVACPLNNRGMARALQPRQAAPVTRQKTALGVRPGGRLICLIYHIPTCSGSGVRSWSTCTNFVISMMRDEQSRTSMCTTMRYGNTVL
jgi:hypothetical protein